MSEKPASYLVLVVSRVGVSTTDVNHSCRLRFSVEVEAVVVDDGVRSKLATWQWPLQLKSATGLLACCRATTQVVQHQTGLQLELGA